MAQTSVSQFAGELKVPPQVLLEQLRAAGVDKQIAEDVLSEQDKTRLLDYLRKSHGTAEPKTKITLTRKQTSEIIKKSDASGKARTIQVEVKKKRVFVKRETPEPAAAEADTAQPTADLQAGQRQEEDRRHAELEARQAAEVAEKQERERQLTEQREATQKKALEEQQTQGKGQTPPQPPGGDTTLHKPRSEEHTSELQS